MNLYIKLINCITNTLKMRIATNFYSLHSQNYLKIQVIYISLVLYLFFPNQSGAQTTISQVTQINTESDWWVELTWSGNPGGNCHCWYNDYFFIYNPPTPSNRLWEAANRSHSTSLYSSTAYGNAKFSLAPGTTNYAIRAQMGANGAYDWFTPGDCFAPCGSNTELSKNVGTSALKMVTNPTQNYFFNASTADLTLSWTVATDIPENVYRLEIRENGQVLFSTTSKSTTSWMVSGLQFGSSHSYTIRTIYNNSTQSDRIVSANVPTPNGVISGKITTGPNGTGGPVGGVTVCAERTTAVVGGNLGVTYCDVSDPADGSYEIRDIYYGPVSNTSAMATFKITPSLNNREFLPAMINKTLTFNTPVSNGVHFEDITSFSVSGTVFQMNGMTQCPLNNVELIAFKNGQAVSAPQKTNINGVYNLVIMDPGVHYIRAKLGNHTFVNDSIMVNVQSDVTGINFTDNDRNILKGYVRAGCQEFIGQAVVTITDSLNCIQTLVTTNAGSGYFEVELPSRYYRVEVTSLTPNAPEIIANEVLAQVGTRRINLDSMIQLDFIYRKPLEVTIFGLPAPSCANVPYPVLQQRNTYPLIIKVTEGPICLSDTGFVVVANAISGDINTSVFDTIPIQDGYAYYELVAGDPNLLGNGHLRSISFVARVGNRNSVPLNRQAVVTGNVLRGNTFVTTSPEIPYLILRDPPGDNSFAFFEQDTTVTLTQSFSGQIGGGVKIWLKAKAGVDIFGLKIWGQIGGSIGISGSTTTSDDFVVELSSSQRFETSNDALVIGPRGDVFVGAALNLKYAAADILNFDLNSCALVKDTALMIDPGDVATKFVYTEGHIRHTLIPQLKELVMLAPPTDTLAIFNATRSIKVWEQILALNEELKEDALSNGSSVNVSFDGASGPITQSFTRSTTTSRSIEFSTIIDAQIAAEVGFEFAGSGVQGGVEVNFRTEIGKASSTTVATTTTTGYVFDDDDVGDFVSVNVATDPVYGTPVFDLLAGATRCPYEEGTTRRDYATLMVTNPIQYGAPGVNELFYNFILGNQSETGNSGHYELMLTNASNPGANVTSGIQSLAQGLQFFALPPGQTMIEVKVSRNMGSSLYSFEGLDFCFYPLCDTAQAACTKISGFFDSPCSDIILANVSNNWLINGASNNMMNVTLQGYDLTSTINEVRLEYAIKGTNSWLPSNIILAKSDLVNNPAGTNKMWQTANIPDGEYDIRLRLNCGISFSYSERRSGRIDRSPPLVYGLEQPLDDDFRDGDEISAIFTEDLHCGVLTNANVTLKMLPQNTIIPAQLICSDRKLTVVPNNDITSFLTQAFEVRITGVRDLFGNTNSNEIVWLFKVGDPDSDMDGIPDSQDRCPGFDDYIDTDLGGVPDGCDCDPMSATYEGLEDDDCDQITNAEDLCPDSTDASLDFDGLDDQVLLPNESNFDFTTAMSVQAWIKVDQFDKDWQAIVSKGDASWRLHRYNLSNVISFGTSGLSDGDLVGTTNVNDGTWHHIAAVFDGSNKYLYVDGHLDASVAVTGTIALSNDPVGIGNNPGLVRYFDGRIDEVAIWNRALSHAEVLESMAKGLKGTETGLVAYYPFNDRKACIENSAAQTATDVTANLHHGVLTNFGLNEGCTSNWAPGSNKINACPGCLEMLELNAASGILDGTYSAKTQIILKAGTMFGVGKTVTLDAPTVLFEMDNAVPATTILTINQEGCED